MYLFFVCVLFGVVVLSRKKETPKLFFAVRALLMLIKL